MLLHMGVWNNPIYKDRKATALLTARPNRCGDFVYHRRDLMPQCVLKLVRSWYPNPPGQDYMGHKWQ